MIGRLQVEQALTELVPNRTVLFETSSKWEADEVERMAKAIIRKEHLPYSYSIAKRFDSKKAKWLVYVICHPPAKVYLIDNETNETFLLNEEGGQE